VSSYTNNYTTPRSLDFGIIIFERTILKNYCELRIGLSLKITF